MKANRKNVVRAIAVCAMTLAPTMAMAQAYTYRAESFEEDAWATKAATVTSTTGQWTSNKNVRSDAQAQDGTYSLLISAKAGIVTPELTEGAGSLVYYAYDQNRQVTVETSTDNATWTTVESYKETSTWTKHVVTINDATVRYVRLSIGSNNNFYLDNLIVTRLDGTDADGNAIVPTVSVPYFVQDFEDETTYPSSKTDAATEQTYNVDGQGEWRYLNAYKATNASYITDGSAHALRMLKSGSHVITPVLSQGVVNLSFNEGRTGKKISIYTSTDGGTTWTLYKQDYKTQTLNTFGINEQTVNRIKIANETTSGDIDIDNLTVTAYPAGTPATVTTADATSVTSSSATVGGSVTAQGDKAVVERGVCWTTTSDTPTVNDNTVKANADTDFTLTIEGVPANTTAYYRAYAISLAGVGYGDVKTFTTQGATTATVETADITLDDFTDEQHIYVIAGGTLKDDGGEQPTEVGVCYSTTGQPTTDGTKATAQLADGTFTTSIALQPETHYYFRAYATNSIGTAYGEQKEYTTAALDIPEYAHHIYYCDPAGDDTTADGSLEKPFFSLQKAVDLVAAGDTIYMNAGTYAYAERINIPTIGKPNSGMIALYARGGRADLDFSAMALADANQGIRLTGSYWHVYGLDIHGAGDNGMLIERNKPTGGSYSDIAALTEQAHDNVIENCTFYKNQDTGLQMKNLAEYNRVINCDAYFNMDPDMGDADGFAVKISHGTGNYFYGCRAWNNSDDGWDQFIKKDGGFPDDVTTTLENCWAFNNGYLEDGSKGTGNGNGFKMGSDQGRNNVIMNRCLAFENMSKGFDQNHNTGSMILNNCTGYSAKDTSSKSHYTYRLDEAVATGKEIRLTNCVAISDGIADRNKSAYAPYSVAGTLVTSDLNTLPADYKSIDPTGSDAPRLSDGSLPVLDFMHIADGNAKLIDTGSTVTAYDGESRYAVGITYNGTAPDLGCYETDEPTAIRDIRVSTNANGRVGIVAAEGGLIVVSVSDADVQSCHTINVYDIAGHRIATQTFQGPATTLRLPYASGMTVVSVNGTQANESVKLLVK